MSYGFLALNDSNEVLITSDARNLHFLQKKIFADICSRLRQMTTGDAPVYLLVLQRKRYTSTVF